MPDWDEDNPHLRQNLAKVLRQILSEARKRLPWSTESIRRWHVAAMRGLDLSPDVPGDAVGKFRGERGLENVGVKIAGQWGLPPGDVAGAVAKFDGTFHEIISRLDELIPSDDLPGPDLLPGVLDVCAWAHAEWVRIHPFANGNGRTARLLANGIAMRYGLPPFIRLRPRPDGDYGTACEAAMKGNWRPTAAVFGEMLNGRLSE